LRILRGAHEVSGLSEGHLLAESVSRRHWRGHIVVVYGIPFALLSWLSRFIVTFPTQDLGYGYFIMTGLCSIDRPLKPTL
jgi:hypothetical protein